MFSDKFGGAPHEASAQWEARKARESAHLDLLDLTVANPTQVGMDYPKEIPSLMNRTSVLDYSPLPQGMHTARQAISEYYHNRGRNILPQDLILTASTSEAYSYLFKLLCNPGDEVLIPSPTYPLFDTLAELENIELVRYPLKIIAKPQERTWAADFNFLRQQISSKCKALILVNPNNPTGHICSEAEIESYLQLAQDYNLALIVDEVFCDFVLGDRLFKPLQSTGPLVFTLNGFSKLLGLPQLKLGWIHVSGAINHKETALSHLEWIADAYLSVNTPVQVAAKDLLERVDPIQLMIKNRLKNNLRLAAELLASHPNALCLKPEAGWSLILEINTPMTDEDFALELIKQKGVMVHAGYLFGFEDGCRIILSLIVPEDIFKEGLKRIIAFAEARVNG